MKGLFHHTATRWALPHAAVQNCLLRYRPSRDEESGLWDPAHFSECVRTCLCLCVSCLEQWMAALSVGERLCMLFMFSEGKRTLSPSSGEQRGVAVTAPRVYLCVSQSKAGDQTTFLSTTERCSSTKSCIRLFLSNHLTRKQVRIKRTEPLWKTHFPLTLHPLCS